MKAIAAQSSGRGRTEELAPPKPLVAAEAAEAVRRVVAAALPGTLNWDINKNRSLWNCVTVAGAGAKFTVNFKSFKFQSRADLADLARIFGTELVSIYVYNQDNLKVISPSWPVASRCRCLTLGSAGASLVTSAS